jgi:hypothetical protein
VATITEDVTALLELMAELGVIEYLTRGRKDYLTVFVRERLPGPIRVNNVQPDMRKPDLPARIESVTVRSAVPNRCSHPSQRIEGNSSRLEPRNAGYAAHGQ